MGKLKLTKTSDAVHKRLSVLIFGEPKVGKTTLAKTLPLTADEKLLYIAADPGQLALRDRDFVVAKPDSGDLTEQFFNDVRDHVRTEGHKYEWIFVDGVDEVADAILKARLKVQRDGRKAYGEMADYVEGWMKAIRDVDGTSVVFVTHIEQRDAGEGEVEYIPSFPGKQIQQHVNEWFDLIGCMRLVRGDGTDYKRYIQFRRDADWRYVVGDRSGVSDLYEAPDLGALFKKIHEAGLEVRGTWQEPKVSKDDMIALAKYAAEYDLTPQQVKDKVKKELDKEVPELTLDELKAVKESIAKGGKGKAK